MLDLVCVYVCPAAGDYRYRVRSYLQELSTIPGRLKFTKTFNVSSIAARPHEHRPDGPDPLRRKGQPCGFPDIEWRGVRGKVRF